MPPQRKTRLIAGVSGLLGAVTSILLICAPTPVQAFSFTLHGAEWKSWPEYCKARCSEIGTCRVGQVHPTMPAETRDHWRSVLGQEVFASVHHGCAGMVYLQRLMRHSGSDMNRRALIKQIKSECDFTLRYTPPDHPIAHKVQVVLARTAYHEGNTAQSFRIFEELLETARDLPDVYAAYGAYLFRERDFSRAREVLEQGLAQVTEPTAEMHYFLGLVLLREKAYANARTHAHEAYRMGYPLPGLKRKLKALGYWEPVDG